MAESFIGMTVDVKLKPPSTRASLTGKVVSIHDQMLTLEHVFFPDTGDRHPSWTVPSFQIADLDVLDTVTPTQTNPSHSLYARRPQTEPYTDPAILSFSRPLPELSASSLPSTPVVETPVKELAADVDHELDSTPSKLPTDGTRAATKRTKQVQAFLQRPLASVKKGKGWRATPLLQETDLPVADTPQILHAQPIKSTSRKSRLSRRERDEQQAMQNGWATEDATDVQDLDDFDFEANLSKFDKQAVFAEIRNDDMTADEDRLVHHNRLARPGTYGGKNLHPTEMVISSPVLPQSEGLDSVSEGEIIDGRTSRQSRISRPRGKQIAERSLSGTLEERSLSRALRSIPSQSRPLNHSAMSVASLNRSTSSFRGAGAHFEVESAHFKMSNSGQTCKYVTPERLHRLENDYARRPGLSTESLMELSGRAVAEHITSSIGELMVPTRRNSRASVTAQQASSNQAKPVVVLLVGNHAAGARAVAAARHLYGRRLKLLLSCTDLNGPRSLHLALQTQLDLLQTLGRRADAKVDSWPTISAYIKKLSSPPALILDALLDGQTFGMIEDVQQAIEVREMIDWCNRSRAQVFSLGCPSGYDAAKGSTTVVEGEPVAVKPERVLALGALVSGVFEAMVSGDRWALTILEVGLLPVMRSDEMVRFGTDWAVEVEFEAGE